MALFCPKKIQLEELKQQMGTLLKEPNALTPPEGLATGHAPLDQFLLWKGLPKGELSCLMGRPGTGATTLWIQTAQKTIEQKKWVAWINSASQLMPANLLVQKVDLNRILVVQKPQTHQQLYWITQELISSNLFETIGCHLNETPQKFPHHYLKKLKNLARLHKVALVFICNYTGSSQLSNLRSSLFSLILHFQKNEIQVRRALHRPTPTPIQWRLQNADFMYQLTDGQTPFMR
ncbi:MAG: DnaB-like helicase C-terminal domain-containing protein [Pseudobdellovibrionaceae bacterium]